MASVVSTGRRLDFRLLGSLEVRSSGQALMLDAPKERALLALLLVHRNEPVAGEHLVEELWGGKPPQRASGALQVYVSHLRKLLEPGRERGRAPVVLQTSPPGYLLSVEDGACDVDRFVGLYERGTRALAGAPERASAILGEALRMWRGPALADFVYEEWAQAEIARLEELRLGCTEQWIEAELACGRHGELVGQLEALVGEHPLRERLRRQLMLVLYRSGRQAGALESYQAARETLVEELGIEPSPELQELNRAILNPGAVAVGAGADPSSTAGGAASGSSECTGRASARARRDELTAAAHRRAHAHVDRSGRDREDAARGRARPPDRRRLRRRGWFVGLAPLPDATLVMLTVAQAVEATGDVVAAIADGRRLLVLDNFEHVLGAAGEVAGLLASCPNLQVLVTSREPLHVAAEHEYAVPGLPCPDAELLFAERARAVRAEFDADGEVTEICERLDGLPLAIELAAARVNVLSAAAIRDRLEHSLSLLTTGARDAPQRHRTLRATIEWSYELLGPAERTLFARLAVFVGGFTLEAAEAVCAADLDTLASLVDKSLVRRDADRFAMLETMREYAFEHLDQSDEGKTRRRHASWFVELAAKAAPHLLSSDQGRWLETLEHDFQNIRLAAAQLRQDGDADRLLQLVASLDTFLRAQVHPAERRRLIVDAVDISEGDLSLARSRALQMLAADLAAAGDVRGAREQLEESTRVSERAGDADGRQAASNLLTLGVIEASAGESDRAASTFDRARRALHEVGDERKEMVALWNLADLALRRGAFEEALDLIDAPLAFHRGKGDALGVAQLLTNRAFALAGLGRPEPAVAAFLESLSLVGQLCWLEGVAYALLGLAHVVAAHDLRESARLLAAADVFVDSAGVALQPFEQGVRERLEAVVTAGVAVEERARFERDALSLDLESAVATARTVAERSVGSLSAP